MRPIWIVLLAGLLSAPLRADQQPPNGVAVIVNDAVITYEDVHQFILKYLELLYQQYGNQPQLLRQKEADLWADGTEQLVERQLILHDYKTTGYNLPESIIDDEIRKRIKKEYFDQATFAKTLREKGLTKEAYRQRLREEFIVEQMSYLHVSKELIISPQKIADFYGANPTNFAVADQVKLSMIVLNKPPGDDHGVTKQLAQEILLKINEGASFEEMARIHSEGSQRAAGGDWGWVERSVLRKELAEVAVKLQKGQRSDVIELPEACFVMLLEDTRPSHLKPLPEVRDEIEKTLLARERDRLQKKWLDRLKAKAFVRYF